ncbi:Zn-ribbon domain-containing OB-fold protein [Halorubrum amylolyticum]|jgi:uncharacterized OB-fold protein|uniref:Zn-ribbon domain-containing OB-fold protein n=1 Tax=Halorubrum amylolyticum TaxID=2508724 RepID=UPI0010091608|nr:Zn-ribbon domain-containing OB-fold protein [Halorubrum amylolyticum]
MSDLPAPEPSITPETEEFWEATTEGRLLIRHCNDCGDAYHYPRTFCPFCGSDDTEWTESGQGEIYAYTVTHQAGGAYGEAAPYILAYVELEEGPRVMTNIVGADPDETEIGDEVEVVFDEASESASLPRFTPK